MDRGSSEGPGAGSVTRTEHGEIRQVAGAGGCWAKGGLYPVAEGGSVGFRAREGPASAVPGGFRCNRRTGWRRELAQEGTTETQVRENGAQMRAVRVEKAREMPWR